MQHVVETAVITIMTHHTMHAQDSRGQWRMGAAMGIGPAKTPLLTSSQRRVVSVNRSAKTLLLTSSQMRVVSVIVVCSTFVCNYFPHFFPSAD